MFPELIRILENEFLPKWEDTQETLIFDEIEEFSIQARMQGAEYGCALLISWSDTVMKQMRQFDMENLSATFEKFPELIKKIRIIAENKETSP